jgi:hypothetical protein
MNVWRLSDAASVKKKLRLKEESQDQFYSLRIMLWPI